jgi:hypothetical protein
VRAWGRGVRRGWEGGGWGRGKEEGEAYGDGIRPPDQGDLVVGFDDSGTLDGWPETDCVDLESPLVVVQFWDLIRVQNVEDGARFEVGAQIPV